MLNNRGYNKMITMIAGLAIVAVTTSAAQAVVLTFQEGVDGYTGTTDTTLSSAQPDNNWGGRDFVQVRGTVNPLHGLIKFDNIFGVGAGQIPLTATAADVTNVTFTMFNFRDNGATGATPLHSVWPVVTPWVDGNGTNTTANDGESTWNHRLHRTDGNYDVNGTDFWGTTTPTEDIGLVFEEDTFGSSANILASVPSLNRGTGTQNVTFNETDFDVTDAVKAWIDGTYANEGFLLGHTNSSRSEEHTSELQSH